MLTVRILFAVLIYLGWTISKEIAQDVKDEYVSAILSIFFDMLTIATAIFLFDRLT